MANKAVRLMIYAKSETGWRRFPVVIGQNGKIRPGFGFVDGQPVQFESYKYQLVSYQGTKQVYTPAGADAAEAMNIWRRAQRAAQIKEEAQLAGIKMVEESKRKKLSTAVTDFIERAEDRDKPEAAKIYRVTLNQFLEVARRQGIQYADEVDEKTMLRFMASLRDAKSADRTLHNKWNNVAALLRWCGVDTKKLGPRPTYEKTVPRVYSKDEVSALLRAADPYMTVVIDLMRKTGIRESECAHLHWNDLDFERGILKVRSKPADGFTIKDAEERDIPMPVDLIEELKAWRKKHPKSRYVVGTKNDRAQTKLLLHLKWVAKRAGLNCGECDGCIARKECENYVLHSFRRTYATSLSRAGVDNRTIMKLTGHSDLATVLRYLSPMETEDSKSLINAVQW